MDKYIDTILTEAVKVQHFAQAILMDEKNVSLTANSLTMAEEIDIHIGRLIESLTELQDALNGRALK